jgi:hypothetical protein
MEQEVSRPYCQAVRMRDGRRCASLAEWIAQAGTRQADAQLCCDTHT